MNGTSHGSALVIVLLLLSTGIICSFALWKSSLLMHDVVRSKEVYYQYYYATEGLLLCGCTIASYNKNRVLHEHGVPAVVTFSAWPITDSKIGRGVLHILAQTPTQIRVRSVLYVADQKVCALTSTIDVQGDHAIISEWSTIHS